MQTNCVPEHMWSYPLCNHLFHKVVACEKLSLLRVPLSDTITCYRRTCLPVKSSILVFLGIWQHSQSLPLSKVVRIQNEQIFTKKKQNISRNVFVLFSIEYVKKDDAFLFYKCFTLHGFYVVIHTMVNHFSSNFLCCLSVDKTIVHPSPRSQELLLCSTTSLHFWINQRRTSWATAALTNMNWTQDWLNCWNIRWLQGSTTWSCSW